MQKEEFYKYLGSAYDGFDASKYPDDLQGWGFHEEFFEKMIVDSKSKLIVEVGSWKGRSAIGMAKILKKNRLTKTKIICVDSWLGATEFIGKDDSDPKRGLRREYGYPTIYFQFLANVVKNDYQDYILPFPQSSINAARFLKNNEIEADLIYVDASHEEKDVFDDINYYWSVLRPGGIMIGDDYCDYWGGVKLAVNEFAFSFAQNNRPNTEHYENGPGEAPSDYWVLTKKQEDWPSVDGKLL